MLGRLLNALLQAACLVCGLTALGLTLVLVYAVEPASFAWRVVEGPALLEGASDAAVPGEDACPPVILARAPIGFSSIAFFATEAVLEVNTYDYLSWDSTLPAALNAYFTPAAGRAYLGQFSRSGLLETVRASYYTVSALSVRPAVVVASTDVGGSRSWIVQVPVTIRYQTGVTEADGGSTQRDQHEVFVVTVLEQRPSAQNYRGVAVNDIMAVGVNGIDDLDDLTGGS